MPGSHNFLAHLLPYPFRVAGIFFVILWGVFFLGLIPIPVLGGILHLGIIPRNPMGLIGILTGPWVHANFNHLLSNQSILLHLVFLSLLKPGREFLVIFLLAVSTGFGVWLFGLMGNHIGASGLIFALQGFNLLTSVYQRNWLIFCILAIFLLIENSFFYGIFGWISFDNASISYSSHISGLVCGILWGVMLRKRRLPQL